MSLDVGVHYSLPVMFHVFPASSEEERKHSSQGSLTWHTSLGQVEKSGTHRLRWEEEENSNIQQPQSHHNVVRCGDALLTPCYVTCVPSSEEERKHSSQGSPTQHTSLGQVEEWDSPAEVGGRRKQQHITTTITSQCR